MSLLLAFAALTTGHRLLRRWDARVMSTIVVRCMRLAIAMIDVMVRMVVAVRVAALVAMMFGGVIVLAAVIAVMIAHMPAVPIAIAAAIIPIMAWIVIRRAAVLHGRERSVFRRPVFPADPREYPDRGNHRHDCAGRGAGLRDPGPAAVHPLEFRGGLRECRGPASASGE